MARYNREFLVPYLHDLCALYLAERKLQNTISQTKQRIRHCSSEHYPRLPKEPEEQSISGWTGFLLIFGGFWIMGGLYLMLDLMTDPSGMGSMPLGAAWAVSFLALFILGAVPLYLGIQDYREREERNKRAKLQYEIQVEKYAREMKQALCDNEDNKKQLPVLRGRLAGQEAELERVQDMRRFVYGANIIPKHYRDFYATVFLYDWFAYGASDDLDMALNTYVLEEIKARLDRIIQQQSEMILNQRLMLAKQRESIEAQNHHNELMRSKLDRLQTTEDERLRYERMTETNTAVTAFFAAANYLNS